MSKEDIIGILGTVLSSVFASLGFLWNIGLLQLIFTFLAGSFLTYVIQRRLQVESEKRKIKRENAVSMRNKVYGPIFREVSRILDSLESVQRLQMDITQELEETMTHYSFYKMERDLKGELYALLDKFEKYKTVYFTVETKVLDAIMNAVRQDYGLDIRRRLGAVNLRLEIEDFMIDSITLEEAILRGIVPKDFVEECKKEWGEDISIEVSFSGAIKNLSDLESLHKIVLNAVKDERIYKNEKKQREILINEFEAFLEKIEPLVEID